MNFKGFLFGYLLLALSASIRLKKKGRRPNHSAPGQTEQENKTAVPEPPAPHEQPRRKHKGTGKASLVRFDQLPAPVVGDWMTYSFNGGEGWSSRAQWPDAEVYEQLVAGAGEVMPMPINTNGSLEPAFFLRPIMGTMRLMRRGFPETFVNLKGPTGKGLQALGAEMFIPIPKADLWHLLLDESPRDYLEVLDLASGVGAPWSRQLVKNVENAKVVAADFKTIRNVGAGQVECADGSELVTIQLNNTAIPAAIDASITEEHGLLKPKSKDVIFMHNGICKCMPGDRLCGGFIPGRDLPGFFQSIVRLLADRGFAVLMTQHIIPTEVLDIARQLPTHHRDVEVSIRLHTHDAGDPDRLSTQHLGDPDAASGTIIIHKKKS